MLFKLFQDQAFAAANPDRNLACPKYVVEIMSFMIP